MTMHKALHPRDDVDKKRGRKRTCQHQRRCWRIDQWLEDYIEKKNEQGLITAIINDTDNTINNRMAITRK